MTFEQWLESRETDTLRHWRVAMCQWAMTVEMEAWQAGYTSAMNEVRKELKESGSVLPLCVVEHTI